MIVLDNSSRSIFRNASKNFQGNFSKNVEKHWSESLFISSSRSSVIFFNIFGDFFRSLFRTAFDFFSESFPRIPSIFFFRKILLEFYEEYWNLVENLFENFCDNSYLTGTVKKFTQNWIQARQGQGMLDFFQLSSSLWPESFSLGGCRRELVNYSVFPSLLAHIDSWTV